MSTYKSPLSPSPSPSESSLCQLSLTRENVKCVDSGGFLSPGRDKAKNSLSFSDICHVATIPSRDECLQPDMDLWWTYKDFIGFKQKRLRECQLGVDVASFNFQKAMAKDELVDIKILIISNERSLSSSLTQNLASALSFYEKELNVNEIELSEQTKIPHKRVRSSVTRVSLFSKEYALAIEGASRDLHYNVVIYDGRHMGNVHNKEWGSVGEEWTGHDQASCCYYSDKMLPCVSKMSPLLLVGVVDISFNENYLLRKIIKSGAALSYICDDVPDSSSSSTSESCSPCTLIEENPADHVPQVWNEIDPRLLFGSTYSLLKDHADVLIGPARSKYFSKRRSFSFLSSSTSNSFMSLEGLQSAKWRSTSPLRQTSPCDSSQTSIESRCISISSNCAMESPTLSVTDWLNLFRLTSRRTMTTLASVQENVFRSSLTEKLIRGSRRKQQANCESLLSLALREDKT